MITVDELAMAICDAADGPCICKARSPAKLDRDFEGCRRALAAALGAWPEVDVVNTGFQSLGVRPDK